MNWETDYRHFFLVRRECLLYIIEQRLEYIIIPNPWTVTVQPWYIYISAYRVLPEQKRTADMKDYENAAAGLRQRIDSLQVVRAIAFSALFVYHAIRTFPGSCRVYHYISTGPGPWGVSVFFVLSGFLMTYSYWDRQPGRTPAGMAGFALKKIRKLYPLHLIMLCVGVVYALRQGANPANLQKYLAKTIPLLQTWFSVGYQAINTVAWYLSVSLFLYFIFPLILPAAKRGTVKESAGKIIAVYLVQVAAGYCVPLYTGFEVKWITYCHPLYRMGDFIIGALTAAFFIKTGKK